MSEDDKDERFYRDTEVIAFPKLHDWQLAVLKPLGHLRMLRSGEPVFKAGQRYLGLIIISRIGSFNLKARPLNRVSGFYISP
jgi:hypothetical protein